MSISSSKQNSKVANNLMFPKYKPTDLKIAYLLIGSPSDDLLNVSTDLNRIKTVFENMGYKNIDIIECKLQWANSKEHIMQKIK